MSKRQSNKKIYNKKYGRWKFKKRYRRDECIQ